VRRHFLVSGDALRDTKKVVRLETELVQVLQPSSGPVYSSYVLSGNNSSLNPNKRRSRMRIG